MKRFGWIVILLILIGSYFLLNRRFEQTYSVIVELPVLKAVEYFGDTTRVGNWMIPFLGKEFDKGKLVREQDTLVMEGRTVFDISFKRGQFPFTISVLPDKDSANRSYFLLNYRTTILDMFRNSQFADDARSSLDSLKQYINSPKKLYGYEVRGELVVDTAFLFSSTKILRADFAKESQALFEMLIAEANKRNAGYNGVRIFHFIDNDSLHRTIYAGVGIVNRVETKPEEKVQYKMMPYQRNLLVVDFEGEYDKITSAYTALEQFKADYRYVSMAIPFHKYLDPGFGFSGNQRVRMKVCYPVF